jgi:predicted permease
MFDLRNDLRWPLRYARRHPAFAVAVTATLAVSIAAATTAFGLATAVLWRPLPFRDPARLVFVWEENDRDGRHDRTRVTGARYAAWRHASNGLEAIALFGAAGFTADSADGAMSVRGVRVSANYFETLGIGPLVGRTFGADDETPGGTRVVILSHALWRERFGGRRDVVGETLRLNGQSYTIVGVMPQAVFPAWPVNPATVTLDPDARQLWVPIARTPALEASARSHVYGVLARLAPGVSERDATERLNRTSDAAAPDPHRARLEPLREQFVGSARAPLIALAAAALAVLLIACTNLAALYVSAYESRRIELAVRAAIGAGVGRLVRQLALEASLFASAGAIGGLAIARVAMAHIPRWLPPSIPLLTAPTIDVPVAAFAIVLAVAASAMLTGWPIVRLIAAAPSPRGTTPPPRAAVYRVLVVSQVAVTVALVAAAGLLGQSLETVRHRDTGFAIDDVLVADVGLPAAATPDPAAIALAERALVDAVAARPRVRAVAAAYDHPLEANWSESLTIVGDAAAPDQRRQVELRIVSPGYVEALDVQLLDGRTFTERDTLQSPGVALVNEAFAGDAGGRVLGRRLLSAPPRFTYGTAAAAEFEIVGIVGNERFRGLEQPSLPAYYLSTRSISADGVLAARPDRPAAARRGCRRSRRGALGQRRGDVHARDVARSHPRRSARRATRDHWRDRRVRERGAGAGGAWHVRTAGGAGRRPHAGDRRSSRDRRAAGSGRAPGRSRKPRQRRRGHRDRQRARARRRIVAPESARRRVGARSGDACHRRRTPRRRRGGGGLPSGAACRAHRSGHRAPRGIGRLVQVIDGRLFAPRFRHSRSACIFCRFARRPRQNRQL